MHLRNKILYGPYLQFNSPTTLPSSARLLSMALSRGTRKLQGTKLPANCPVLWFWLLYHLLFLQSTCENKTFISKLLTDISCLAYLCPQWYQRAPLCVWDEQTQSNCPLWMIFWPQLNLSFGILCWNGRRFVWKQHMRTPSSWQCPRLSQTLRLCKLNFPEVNWNTFLRKY